MTKVEWIREYRMLHNVSYKVALLQYEIRKLLIDARSAILDGRMEDLRGILTGDACSTVIERMTLE